MDIGLAPAPLTLESRYIELDRPVFMTGVQALVRVLLEQARLDQAAGLNTAALVSGYRGSPLGGLDQELWRRKKLLDAHRIRFQPGLNEDLGATMLWGTQQLDAFPGKRVDGVYGMWYGKGPGVDRSGDALRCANILGTAARGGMLAVAGDDHGAQSSVYPHQTDQLFQGWMLPVLAPADVQDIIDLGLAGLAMSRASGLWVALKLTSETAEQAASIIVPSERHFALPAKGAVNLNFDPTLVFPRDRAELERRVLQFRLPAALEFARLNHLNRLIRGDADAPVGIVTVGKAHADTLHALRAMGLDQDPRVALFKVGMVWPLETEALRAFARGKRVLLVVEEKRALVESELRDALYNLPADQRPMILGKTGANGEALISPLMEIAPEDVARALIRAMRDAGVEPPALPPRFEPGTDAAGDPGLLVRAAAFCAGCPHGTSTKIPDGSFANAGIGCHFLALGEDPNTRTFSQMGGEGIGWVGMAPFTDVPHMFVNLGDGTYQHSGILAIRQAVVSGANVTYKILFNDAVAMTGGQPAEGAPSVPQIAAQVAAEGVARVAIVADSADRLPPVGVLPKGTTLHVRDEMDALQRQLRDTKGVTVLIYDQVCATEKRRRRKRGKMAQAEVAVQINAAVCENCGDCSTQSNCIAIEPVETDLGRKRRVNPTSCNVDLSCLKGFCPSFVTTIGATGKPVIDPTWQAREAALGAALPQPAMPALPWRGLFVGIGGGGIVTAGAILAQAAHLEGWTVSTLDFTGLAQKNGAVISHVQVGRADQLDVVRIPRNQADVMIAADLAVAASPAALEHVRPNGSVIGNLDLASTAAFKRDPLLAIEPARQRRAIERHVAPPGNIWLHAERLAERLFGNAQTLNTLLLGLAYQQGKLPVGEAAILQAIELNGTAVALNRRAFLWGRILAVNPDMAETILAGSAAEAPRTLDALVAHHMAFLTEYQDASYAALYRQRVDAAIEAEIGAAGSLGAFARAAAENWFRVMAYKDEYEVARLHIAAGYKPSQKPAFHLAPPLITRRDPATGRRRKIAIPGWLALPVFRVLRHGKRLRGGAWDLFGRQEDRRMERAMIAAYEEDMAAASAALRHNPAAALALAGWPEQVRGFGPVKLQNWEKARKLRAAWRLALQTLPIAAE
jgi:indolepyruvate ferredoxin oxidoreductase